MYYIKKYKYVIVIILLFIFLISNFLNKDDIVLEDNIENNIEVKTNNIKENKKIKVDIKGAVKNPGVYEMDENSYVSDLINLSGGLDNNADTSTINLSKKLKDEMVVVIYTKEEINNLLKGDKEIKYIEKECFCPKLENDACINNNFATDKISLNNASLEELMNLDGIGEKKAKDIIEYRNKNNGFKSIDELKEVSGIGEATFNKIKDKLDL